MNASDDERSLQSPLSSYSGLRRQYVKFCDLPDFDDPALRRRIAEIVPGLNARTELHRKHWEFAMLTLFLEDVGLLDPGAEALAVGAGHEYVLYWLANRLGRVVATDIYGEGPFAEREADALMLTDPSTFAPYPYPRERLEVLKMDGRSLAFAEESFDIVFSLSSIEHFGGPGDIACAAAEIGRVLRPGGCAFIVTECYVARHPLNSKIVRTGLKVLTLGRVALYAEDVFKKRDLETWIVRPSGLELVQPLDDTLSPETFGNIIHVEGDCLRPETGNPHPHLLLVAQRSPWTSVALALRKSGGT